ncbi:hypothetical protein PPL_09918 [Heterostelium album PN500]|uniref:DUF6606 domain-containing protein n=1 Tax=Heterostelium pallidum (strain ATCC 26659 / Pp 5 / PN500) TaxID=670386 RepID=D3BPQ1_HETP5|nr:hypothetical protein PPL_09918 [Heterostelium album PN500]EFA76613.1 hypothetical protein PPL_09918 [Heterostelium album PN500]|eukprot:XP_020428745.1 hypothetical protein PPL_09918 [Heterostelium album PN500]
MDYNRLFNYVLILSDEKKNHDLIVQLNIINVSKCFKDNLQDTFVPHLLQEVLRGCFFKELNFGVFRFKKMIENNWLVLFKEMDLDTPESLYYLSEDALINLFMGTVLPGESSLETETKVGLEILRSFEKVISILKFNEKKLLFNNNTILFQEIVSEIISSIENPQDTATVKKKLQTNKAVCFYLPIYNCILFQTPKDSTLYLNKIYPELSEFSTTTTKLRMTTPFSIYKSLHYSFQDIHIDHLINLRDQKEMPNNIKQSPIIKNEGSIGLITSWLLPSIATCLQLGSTMENQTFYKSVHPEHIIIKNSNKSPQNSSVETTTPIPPNPWRRSPMWIAFKSLIHTLCQQHCKESTIFYKSMMLSFYSLILKNKGSKQLTPRHSEWIPKIIHRCYKLEELLSLDQFKDQRVITMPIINECRLQMESLHDRLNRQWIDYCEYRNAKLNIKPSLDVIVNGLTGDSIVDTIHDFNSYFEFEDSITTMEEERINNNSTWKDSIVNRVAVPMKPLGSLLGKDSSLERKVKIITKYLADCEKDISNMRIALYQIEDLIFDGGIISKLDSSQLVDIMFAMGSVGKSAVSKCPIMSNRLTLAFYILVYHIDRKVAVECGDSELYNRHPPIFQEKELSHLFVTSKKAYCRFTIR